MANQPLAFAELLAGAVILVAAVKGDSIANVINGTATQHSAGLGTTSSTGATTTTAAAGDPPAQVTAMLAAAQSVVGAPYSTAGHDTQGASASTIKQLGTDCSGFVSWVLEAGGVNLGGSTQTTVTLKSLSSMLPGPGQYVTIYDKPLSGQLGHTFIDINGNYFESGGGSNTSGGIIQMTQQEVQSELAGGGFITLHPSGL